MTSIYHAGAEYLVTDPDAVLIAADADAPTFLIRAIGLLPYGSLVASGATEADVRELAAYLFDELSVAIGDPDS